MFLADVSNRCRPLTVCLCIFTKLRLWLNSELSAFSSRFLSVVSPGSLHMNEHWEHHLCTQSLIKWEFLDCFFFAKCHKVNHFHWSPADSRGTALLLTLHFHLPVGFNGHSAKSLFRIGSIKILFFLEQCGKKKLCRAKLLYHQEDGLGNKLHGSVLTHRILKIDWLLCVFQE